MGSRQKIADPAERGAQPQFDADQRVEHGAMRERKERRGKTLAFRVGDRHAQLRVGVGDEIERVAADGFRRQRASGDLDARKRGRHLRRETLQDFARNLDFAVEARLPYQLLVQQRALDHHGRLPCEHGRELSHHLSQGTDR